ncbi:MAG: hypothetical protein A2252_10535 [Elusimicrobia bacterium RIFOXYA2_FULL_39_19]|nr:MAG: hypothetical protein A2252_10535 [Elusimicrobia bacterium RIFOXYA2_FULL_39_19]
MENIKKCIICAEEGKILFKMEDYTVRKCCQCDLSWVEEVFEESILKEKDYYWARDFFVKNEKLLRDFSSNEVKEIIKLLKFKTLAGLKWLDIGSGIGYMISEARKLGAEVTGIEINKDTAELVRKREDLNVLHTSIKECNLPENSFNVITIFDVLEHLLDPEEALKKANFLLKTGGLLAVEVPDDKSLFRKISYFLHDASKGKINTFIRHAFHKHPGGHRIAYSKKSLNILLEKHRFKVFHTGKTMIPYALFIDETIRNKKFFSKIFYFTVSSAIYFLSILTGTQNRIKLYAKKI